MTTKEYLEAAIKVLEDENIDEFNAIEQGLVLIEKPLKNSEHKL
jgi:hypothetical protein